MILKIRRGLRKVVANFSSHSLIYVFHHIPKCGGSSLTGVLKEWFVIKQDYRKDYNSQFPDNIDLRNLRTDHCLSGHWEIEGSYLNQRYPEVFNSDRYRLITFVRDPLDVQLSLFAYEINQKVNREESIEKFLQLRPNYMASIFRVRSDNYKEILDKYYFKKVLIA